MEYLGDYYPPMWLEPNNYSEYEMQTEVLEDLEMEIEEIVLRDAWTVATECGQELAAIVDELSELAKEENKVDEWKIALMRLGRAERASLKAAETMAPLIPSLEE